MFLPGKVVLITGGAIRIGRAIALTLAERGMRVVVHYRHSESEALELVDMINGMGSCAWSVRADLSSEDACRRVMSEAFSMAGGLDALVNNAAVFHKDTFPNITERTLMNEFWPNLFAPVLLMKTFAERAKRGGVVNLLDRRVEGLDTTCVPYWLTKKSLADATQLAARVYAPDITVNAVAPGAILPPSNGLTVVEAAGTIPLAHRGTPQDVARAVAWLLENDLVTGQILFVDGGQHLMG